MVAKLQMPDDSEKFLCHSSSFSLKVWTYGRVKGETVVKAFTFGACIR